MLNKKTLCHIVYAIALVGAITSCFGILNELLNLIQIYNKKVSNLMNRPYQGVFWITFAFHLVAFVLCAVTVTILILYVTNVLKEKHIWITNVCIITTCIILLALSLTFIYHIQRLDSYKNYAIGAFDYTTLYTFRSIIMSFIAYVGTILLCNVIQTGSKKKAVENPADKETQEPIEK